jgi:hypothetical protein
MTKRTHNIDFDELKDFAHVGVRRAVIFMRLGLNAAHREDFLDYELSKIRSSTGERRFPIEFFPEALPAERLNYFKVEFARWIQDCCLCDLLEHHALFLDKIHLHALVVYTPKFNFIGIGNETGKETPLAAIIGERTTEETTIALRVEQRETTYKAGERIEAARKTWKRSSTSLRAGHPFHPHGVRRFPYGERHSAGERERLPSISATRPIFWTSARLCSK